jgi:hypothetical protein
LDQRFENKSEIGKSDHIIQHSRELVTTDRDLAIVFQSGPFEDAYIAIFADVA